MLINDVATISFRNLVDGRVRLSPGMNILQGPNGAGKTNILEAILVAAAGFSVRARVLADIPTFGATAFSTTAHFRSSHCGDVTANAKYTGAARLSHSVVPRVIIPVTIFSPDDLQLVKGGPSARRQYLDQTLFTINPPYRRHWRSYRTALTQRNALLRNIRSRRATEDQLAAWDGQLAEQGGYICAARHTACQRLAGHAQEAHRHLASSSPSAAIEYVPALPTPLPAPKRDQDWVQALTASLTTAMTTDIAAGMTTFGPHRDDVLITLASRNAREFASQGQQRTIALALRLAQHALFERTAGESGVLLLDDIASELDDDRRHALGSALAGRQAIITTTDAALFPPPDLSITVANGIVSQS